jgi:hypothetical protein
VVLLSVIGLGLGGCEHLKGLMAAQQPGQGNPDVRWVSESTEILDLRGPATAQVGVPVELTVQVVIGSSSCNRVGEVLLDVDDAARTVTVRATRLTAQADPPIPCTDDYGWTSQKASFTPMATGTYRVVAQAFKPGYGAPGEPAPRGTLDIEVLAPL